MLKAFPKLLIIMSPLQLAKPPSCVHQHTCKPSYILSTFHKVSWPSQLCSLMCFPSKARLICTKIPFFHRANPYSVFLLHLFSDPLSYSILEGTSSFLYLPFQEHDLCIEGSTGELLTVCELFGILCFAGPDSQRQDHVRLVSISATILAQPSSSQARVNSSFGMAIPMLNFIFFQNLIFIINISSA